MSTILPGGEPFYFQGGPSGCLLVHGFTGAPKEMRPLGEHLARDGHTVLAVRLFGHATEVKDMNRARWRDWLAGVEDGYLLLRQSCHQVFVMGLSMGGALSLALAARHPVDGVVAMSTPFQLPPDPRLPFLKPISFLVRTIAKGDPDWRDPALEADHLHYPRYPVRAIAELRDLLADLRRGLPEVTAPALIIHSSGDQGVAPQDAERIYAQLGSPQKELFWVHESGHVITRDQERGRVFASISSFLRSLSGKDR